MKVILTKTNEVKNVSLGYAVNYLLPKKLGIIATKKRLEELKVKKVEIETAGKEKNHADRQQAERLDGKVIEFSKTSGKAGKIHGSITKKELAMELKVLKTNIELPEPIKKVGEYTVDLKFGDAKAKIKVVVKAKKE
jgi:large subunit ribosomal protein L9